jgi:hypothetical protein
MTKLEENQEKYPLDFHKVLRGGFDALERDSKLEQLTYTQEQRQLLGQQIAYTRTIKWATIAMAGATIIMAIATCVLAFR